MSEPQPPVDGEVLAELREHTRWLARDLAGPLRRLSVKAGDASIQVEWQPHAAAAENSPPAPASAEPAETQEVDGETMVCSPMVGTVYWSPSPDAPPFVVVGDTVEPGQTVAIVEAMKLFNPITSEVPGIVTEVLAGNGQPVQFGEPLLRLKSSSDAAPASDAGGKE